MDGQFECRLFMDDGNTLFGCETPWGTFSGTSYAEALQAAITSAQQVLGGGSGTWLPIVKAN